jgi:hypothetical protein
MGQIITISIADPIFMHFPAAQCDLKAGWLRILCKDRQ